MLDAPLAKAWNASLWEAYRRRRFKVLLLLLIGLLAGPPVLLDSGRSAGWFDELLVVTLLASILSLCAEPRQRLFALIFGVPTIVFWISGYALLSHVGSVPFLLAQLSQIAFLFAAAGLVVRSLFSETELSLDSVLGAICGYLFLGLGWAVAYSMVDRFRPGSFALHESLVAVSESPPSLQLLTYSSFVTLSTVGYGDMAPVSSAARTLAWIEAVVGQFYVAVIVAGIVSMIVTARDRGSPVQER